MIMSWLYLISLQIKIDLLNYSNMAMSNLVVFFPPWSLLSFKKNSIHSIHIIQSLVSATTYKSVTPDLYFQTICSFEFQMHTSSALLDISIWMFNKYFKLIEPHSCVLDLGVTSTQTQNSEVIFYFFLSFLHPLINVQQVLPILFVPLSLS